MSGVPDNALLRPLRIGAIDLPNRIVMAPMTRCRADAGGVPGPLMATYYGQRASAGLVITEATQIAPEGSGFIATPGIHDTAQAEGWRSVVDAVHGRGGRIVLQLWHAGRMSHPMLIGGATPVAPSAVAPPGEIFTPEGPRPAPVPRALDTSEVFEVVASFGRAAGLAKEAGFDGVEIHAANGYLIDQFMRDSSNQREDRYGGTLSNRLRFLNEVTTEVCEAWGGAERVGVRLNPSNVGAMLDSDPDATFTAAAELLDAFGLAYLHLLEFPSGHPYADTDGRADRLALLRRAFSGPLIASGGYDVGRALTAVADGAADAVAFGSLFVANPDLPRRISEGAALADPDPATFYQGGETGYVDYPEMERAREMAAGSQDRSATLPFQRSL